MLKFSDDEAVQKAACRSLLNLTPSVEGDEYQKIRSQDGALAQSIFYAIFVKIIFDYEPRATKIAQRAAGK